MSITLGGGQRTERESRRTMLGILLIGMLANHAFGQEAEVTAFPEAPMPQPTSSILLGTEVHNDPSTFKTSHNDRPWDYTFAATTVVYIAADMYDVRNSERAYKLGYVESNTFLVCGDAPSVVCRPHASALYMRDGIGFTLAATCDPRARLSP